MEPITDPASPEWSPPRDDHSRKKKKDDDKDKDDKKKTKKPVVTALPPGIYNILDPKNHALTTQPSGESLVPTTNVVSTAQNQQWLVDAYGVIMPMDVSNGTKTCATLADFKAPAAHANVILNPDTELVRWFICGVSYYDKKTPFYTAYIMTHNNDKELFYWGLDSNGTVELKTTTSKDTVWVFEPVIENTSKLFEVDWD